MDDVTYGRICALHDLGKSVVEIAEIVKVPKSTCYYWLSKGSPPSVTQRPCRPTSTRVANRRQLVMQLRARKHTVVGTAFTPVRRKLKVREVILRDYPSPSAISRRLATEFNCIASPHTVRRDLLSSGCKAMKRRKVSSLTARHKVARVAFAQWYLENRPLIIFSDEKDFDSDQDRNTWEWLTPGEQRNGAAGDRSCQKVSMWGAITPDGSVIAAMYAKENLDSVKYLKLLERVVPHLRTATKKGYVLMQDGARAHCGSDAWLRRRHVAMLPVPWPALSSDLNPIEQLWSILDVKVKARGPYGAEELERYVIEELRKVPRRTVQGLVASMESRCRKVIAAKGEFIKP